MPTFDVTAEYTRVVIAEDEAEAQEIIEEEFKNEFAGIYPEIKEVVKVHE